MVPLRRVDETEADGHVTSTVREWKRRDWGDGGLDFHWWCTDAPDAFGGARMVYEEMAGELRVLVGDEVYALLARHLDRRRRAGDEVFLPHPALKRR